MPFVNNPRARMSGTFLYCVDADLMFSGPRKGRTHSILSVSTSATIGHRFLPWFTSTLVLFLSPLFLLGFTVSRGLTLPFCEHDPQSVGLGISLVSVYWGLTLLMLGMHSVDIEHRYLTGL